VGKVSGGEFTVEEFAGRKSAVEGLLAVSMPVGSLLVQFVVSDFAGGEFTCAELLPMELRWGVRRWEVCRREICQRRVCRWGVCFLPLFPFLKVLFPIFCLSVLHLYSRYVTSSLFLFDYLAHRFSDYQPSLLT
jgi:hypothetical protein